MTAVVEAETSTPVIVTTVLDPTPIVTYFIPRGTGTRTRITSVQVKGLIKRNVASALIDDWRVDLVLDREPAKTILSPLLCYTDATPSIGAFKNFLYKDRFKILRTQSGMFGEGGTGVSGVMINWYVKLNLICSTEVPDNYQQGAVLKNAIYLVYWTTSVANHPIPSLDYRIITSDTGIQ